MNLYLDGTPEVLAVRAKTLAEGGQTGCAAVEHQLCMGGDGRWRCGDRAVDGPDYSDECSLGGAGGAFIGDPMAHQRFTDGEQRDAPISGGRGANVGLAQVDAGVNQMLRSLTSAASALVRVEAYKVLTSNGAAGRVVHPARPGG